MAARYRKPRWIEEAAKRKYGRSIFVLGATQDEINKFWRNVSYHALESTRPTEKGRAIVDIDCKTHVNKAEDDERQDETSSDKPKDWFDEFEITSKKGSNEARSKSYQVQLGTSKTRQFGGNLNVKVGGSGFFNMAGASTPIGAEGGISGSYIKTKTEQTTTEDKREETLSQEYQIVDRLKVPPKTKVRVEITTWAVTYESTTVTELLVDARASLPVRYRTSVAKLFGGICTSIGSLTAEDLFVNEQNYKSEDEVVTFTREGKISYLGEEVEIVKKKITVPVNEIHEL